MEDRVYNYSAGPAVLPVAALEEAQRNLMAMPGVGSSILEISHRSKAFTEIIEQAEANFRKLLAIPDNFRNIWHWSVHTHPLGKLRKAPNVTKNELSRSRRGRGCRPAGSSRGTGHWWSQPQHPRRQKHHLRPMAQVPQDPRRRFRKIGGVTILDRPISCSPHGRVVLIKRPFPVGSTASAPPRPASLNIKD